jgi:HlyD family secretion protein
MRASKLALRVAVPVLLAGAAAWYLHGRGAGEVKYITAPVTRGSIVRAVTATGTVNPVTTVQVGTYVSGPIVAINVDFNSAVKAGQLLAKIDPRPFAATVAMQRAALANARAQLQKDQANLVYQKLTYERDVPLVKGSVISQDALDNQFSVYNQAVAQVVLDQAAIQQQVASLQTAELNLNYTNIVSPVDGTVVSRNVDVGQTVAASFQTPTLFLIAKDLTRMQVDSNVSESDIGDVRAGQHAQFTVDAYGDRSFDGVINQVRQAPITVQNVVTYDVVIDVDNPELLLMPGMTASATIVTARRDDVIRVPMEALRFSPRRSGAPRASAEGGATAEGKRSQRNQRVFVPDGARIKPVKITAGLDDGTNVELLSGDLQPDDVVVTDEVRPVVKSASSASSSAPPGMGGHFPH